MDNISSVICCGCGNCSRICPTECISIQMDRDGFWKAVCDENRCIHCGKCRAECPMLSPRDSERRPLELYAAAARDEKIYHAGSSGGVFPQLAVNMLEKGGYVWGCGYRKDLLPIHKGIHCVEELDDLCRSKYVQSDLGNAFSEIQTCLQAGEKVLFVGTPCQVEAMRKLADTEELYLIDIVCHGVPSAGMFRQNIEFIEKSRGKKLSRYEFRLKSPQTKKSTEYIYSYTDTDGEKVSGPYYKDAYFNAFYDMVSLNESCYHCPFACGDRPGDLTIGDYEWGKKHYPELQSFGDISCILVNTDKGRQMLKWIEGDMIIAPTKWEYIIEKNQNLVRPTPRPQYRDRIYEEIRTLGYDAWASGYFKSLRYFKKLPILRPLVKIKILLNKAKRGN